jgi:hypothetical protein
MQELILHMATLLSTSRTTEKKRYINYWKKNLASSLVLLVYLFGCLLFFKCSLFTVELGQKVNELIDSSVNCSHMLIASKGFLNNHMVTSI